MIFESRQTWIQTPILSRGGGIRGQFPRRAQDLLPGPKAAVLEDFVDERSVGRPGQSPPSKKMGRETSAMTAGY